MEPRAELEGIVQRLTQQQQVWSEDVSYETVELTEGGFCSTVLIAALGHISFTSEVCGSAEEAETAAILAALAEFAAVGELAAKHLTPRPPVQARKRLATHALVRGELERGRRVAEGPACEGDNEVVAEPAAKRLHSGSGCFPGTRWPPSPQPMITRPPLPVGPCRLSPTGLTPIANGQGPCRPVGRGTPLTRPSPLFQKHTSSDTSMAAAGANAKGQLNEFLAKVLGRSLTKEDQLYSVSLVAGCFTATLVLPCMGASEYTGTPASKRKDAEQNAAATALAALKSMVPPVLLKTKGKASSAKSLSGGDGSPAASPRSNAQDTSEFQEWQEARLEPLDENDVADSRTLDLWYGQLCLVCLAVCPKSGWATHAAGQKHQKKFETSPMKKRLELPRPPTEPNRELLPASQFVEISGWTQLDAEGMAVPVLLVGEMDYSFSLAVAKLRPAGSPLVATSYLEEHDPDEPEVYPADDGERANYKRRSLPAMNGALHRNLEALGDLGAEVRHGVDATQLQDTLRSQGIDGAFQRVIFPFPRASLQRACDPRNSRLLRNFFLSVTQEGFVMEGGMVQLVMLTAQYEEWDVACMAMEAGLELSNRAQLPPDFYQSREMSGKPWTPQGAELLCFSAAF